MALRTALVIDGDSESGKQALADLDGAIGRSEKQARQLASAFSAADVATTRLAQAQTAAKTQSDATRAAYKAGEIGLEQYNRELLETNTALGLVAAKHRETVAELRNAQGAYDGAIGRGQQFVNSMRQQRMGAQQLAMNLSDMTTMFALGARPMQIFASQSGQVIQSVQLMTGGTGALAAFMMSGWGTAVTAGAMVLVPLIGYLLDSNDAAAESERKHRTLAEVLQDNTSSYTELKGAVDDYNRAKEREAEKTTAALELQRQAIEANYNEALSIREKIKAQLEYWQSQASENHILSGGPGAGGVAQAEAVRTAAALERQIAEQDALISGYKDAIRRTTGDIAEILSDPEKQIRDHFVTLRRQLEDQGLGVDELTRKYRELNDQEQAALKAMRETRRSAGEGVQASIGDMKALIRQLFPGATITSGLRPGDEGSDHSVGRAIDFVPAGGMGQYTTAQVEQILRDAGVDIRRNDRGTPQMFGPGRSAERRGDHDDHFHFAWQGSPSPEGAQRLAERAAREMEREREQAVRRQRDFDQASASLDARELQVRRAAMVDVDKIADFQRDQVAVEMEKYRLSVEAQVQLGDLTRAQADELERKSALIATIETETIERERQAANLRTASELAGAHHEVARQALDAQMELADTEEGRKSLALQIFDAEEAYLRSKLEAIKLSGTANLAEKQRAQILLDGLTATADSRREGVARGNATTVERYLRELHQTPAQINEAMDAIKIDGLDALNDGLVDAIMGVRSLGDVFHDIAGQILADLLRIAIQRAIIGPLADALFGGAGGGGASSLGGSLASGAASGGGGFLGSIIGALFGGGRAEGGPVSPGKFYAVNERSTAPGLFFPIGPGVIQPAGRGDGVNDNPTHVSLRINNDFRGAAPEAVAQLTARIDQMQRELPGKIVMTMQDARARFVWRDR